MNALVKKEIRLLLPRFGIALVLALSVWLIPTETGQPNSRWLLLIFLPLLLCPALVAMLALDSFGRELSTGTFSNLLAQPVSRTRVWWTKTLLLAAVILSVWAAWWFSVSTNSHLVMNSQQRLEILTATLLIALAIYSGGLWTVLLLRQVAAAFWFTLLLPAFLAVLTAHFTGKYGSEDAILGNLVVVIVLYSLAGFFWARRMFLRAEDLAWTGGNITLPGWLKLPGRAGPVAAIRGQRPRLALIAKEFKLHQSTFVIAGVLAVLHICILTARKFGGGFKDSPTLEILTEAFWVFWPVMPLLIGCAAVAEERKLGTMEGQLCLPARRRTQFIIKFGVALALAIFFGVIMPVLFEVGRILPDIPMKLAARNDDSSLLHVISYSPVLFGLLKFVAPLLPLLPLTLFASTFLCVAFYASTLARNTLQAIAPAIVGILVAWTVLFGARFIEDLVHYPLWRGGLIYLIGVPVLTVTLGMLMFWNFKRVLVGWPVWRRNLSVLAMALVVVTGLTTAIYQRAWELLGQLEPAHGAARLADATHVRLHNNGHRIFSLLPDGRGWSARFVFARPGSPEAVTSARELHAPIGTGRFLDGSNWVDVAYNGRDAVALHGDGSLWVSETPDSRRDIWPNNQSPPPEPEKLVRYGNESDWKNIVGRWNEVLALKADGSLWRIGTNRFNQKKPWPGLRAFSPARVGTNSDWAELFSINDRLALRNAAGRLYVAPPYIMNQGEMLKLDDDLKFQRVPYLEQSRWRSLIWTSSRRTGMFQVGVAQDGGFYVLSGFRPSSTNRSELVPLRLRLGHDTNWVAVVGAYGTPVTLKSDGSLWAWDFPVFPETDPESPHARRLSEHSDWRAIADDSAGVIALAADGSLWFWHLPARYGSQNLWPLLRPTRRPQVLGNIFAPAE